MNISLLRCGALLCALGGLLAGSISLAADVPYFTDNGYGNPVSTMQHPEGEYFQGVTYVTFQGPHEDPYVAAYNHITGQWLGPVRVGVNTMGKSPDQIDPGELDNHGRPALFIDGQGYIHVVFGAHGGDPVYGVDRFGTPGKGRLTHVISTQPDEISTWKTYYLTSPFATYTQWVRTPNGDLYLFYRHGSHRSDWVYQKSVDGGRTFAPEVSVLKSKISSFSRTTHDAWYAWFDNGKGNTITAHYVYHPCADFPNHTSMRENLYYMQMDGRDGSWTNVQGAPLALPVTKEYADQHTIILNSGKNKTHRGVAHVDPAGNPQIIFALRRKLYFVRWLGHAWQAPVPVEAAGQGRLGLGDFIVDSSTRIRALLTSNHDGVGEVGWWNSDDGGLTWTKGRVLLAVKGSSFVATSFIRYANPDALMVVSETVHGQGNLYHHLYLIGDKGPIGRPAAGASNLGDRLQKLKLLPKGTPKEDAKRRKKKNALLKAGDEN